MTAIRPWIARCPLSSYYLGAFAISWTGVLVAIGGPSGLLRRALTGPTLATGIATTLLGPPIAGVVMTAVLGGQAGLRDLASRLLAWRVGARWYAAAVLTAPLSVTVALLALSLFSSAFVPRYLAGSEVAPGALVMGVPTILAVAVVTGFCEELGWTGFATPRMTLRYGTAITGVRMGFLWGLWHLVSNLVGSTASAGTLPLVIYLAAMLFTFLPPYRVLMVWVYAHTQSLPVAMLMHASLVTSWLISMPQGITGAPQATWYVVWGLVLWGMVAAVAIGNGTWRLRPAGAWPPTGA
jgi:membrane protease YdiL (CAAX protease family)